MSTKSKRQTPHIPPSMPMGAKYDPELSLLDNARHAWDADQARQREHAERAAKIAMRKAFGYEFSEAVEFRYHEAIEPATPTWIVDDEVVGFDPHDRSLFLTELCGGCGKQWRRRYFSTLAGLGRAIHMADEDDAFVCQMCRIGGVKP